MAYPPTIPPANRTNTTPQADNHPSDHNGISNALKDIINELGNNPSDGVNTVQKRLSNLEANKLSKSGGAMDSGGSGIDMNGCPIFDLPDPPGPNGAVTKEYCDRKVLVAGDNMTGTLRVGGDPSANAGCEFYPAGRGWFTEEDDGPAVLALRFRGAAATAIGNPFIRFTNSDAGNIVGSITKSSAGNVAYNTSSDPRIKNNLGPITDAAARIVQLAGTAFRGTWKSDEPGSGEEWDMLYSTDVNVVAPYAVAGAPNAVDAEGNIVPQQVDYSSLVPLLVSALGDALNRITVLETGP